MKMDEFKVVYQDRVLKVTRMPRLEKGCKYKIEITDGRFFKSWQKYYVNDEEAIRSANREFGSLFDSIRPR